MHERSPPRRPGASARCWTPRLGWRSTSRAALPTLECVRPAAPTKVGHCRLVVLLLLGICLLGLLFGCARLGEGGARVRSRALQGYLAVGRDAVVFVQLIPGGAGEVSGAVSLVALAAGEPPTVRRASAAFTGVVSDDGDVALSFPEGRGVPTAWTGRLEGQALALGYPGADGRPVTFTLHPGDSDGYRAAVAALEQEAVGRAAGRMVWAARAAPASRSSRAPADAGGFGA